MITLISCLKNCIAVFWTSTKSSISMCSEKILSCYVIEFSQFVQLKLISNFATWVELASVSLSSTILLYKIICSKRIIDKVNNVPGVKTWPYERPARDEERQQRNWTRRHFLFQKPLVLTDQSWRNVMAAGLLLLPLQPAQKIGRVHLIYSCSLKCKLSAEGGSRQH